jgi:hypothetical protein
VTPPPVQFSGPVPILRPWDENHGFREVTLAYFPEADAAALRRLGRYWHNAAVFQFRARAGESRNLLWGAVADLRFIVGLLSDRATLGVDAKAQKAINLAPELAAEVQAIADRLTGVLP